MTLPAEAPDLRLERGVGAVLAAAAVMPQGEDLAAEMEILRLAEERGYFLPDEDERVRAAYAGYLAVRAGLLGALEALEPLAGHSTGDWEQRFDAFLAAFAASCLLMHGSGWVGDLGAAHPVLWKKLDEAESRYGIPRKTFTRMFRSAAEPRNTARFAAAVDYYRAHPAEVAARAEDPLMGPVVALLGRLEECLPQRRDLRRRLAAYRWFSFKRRPHSGYKRVMFGLLRAGGWAVAEIRQPGVKPLGAPKRIGEGELRRLLELLEPGDVVVSRHDDAMSNLFLPGFWPHSILHLGSEAQRSAIGLELPRSTARRAADPARFLEAKKDGVRFRVAGESLAVDAVAVLRPPLEPEDLATALAQAATHAGKLYDFAFDFRKSDRLVCSELVYRGFHGVGGLSFDLIEHAGRVCLPTRELARQALVSGFTVVAVANLGGDGVVTGNTAAERFATSLD